MNEMIDRVAKAILDQGPEYASSTTLARAAIAAMREPTPEMIQRGLDARGMTRAWQAMIDAALADEPQVLE